MIEPRDDLDVALADRYHIEQEVGSGGMAKVYLAEDMKHHRKVAVKILRPELAAALGSDRFLREIEVTARLTHPHILPLHDSGEAIGCLYYVMPYVKGESLRECLTRHGQLAIDDAVRITEQVASALDFAHRHGVVHRDIKPENILLHEGEAMVADFGIALAVSAAADERLTETGLSLGTPAYMSPEQICGGREIDARSDIYSLACVLYEMLGGAPPFTASTPRGVLARHVTDPVPPITTVRSSVPRPVVAAMTKALGKTPADRFESAKAFAEALTAEPTEAEPEIRSIVVLPFENLSPDPDQEYFSDGLTEEVISDLSKVRSLRVISRSSAMTFKGSEKRIPEIAEALNVRYVLEGSVRKAANSLRITAQLIDAKSDVHLWAEKYTGTLEDVFDIQEQVSRAIVDALMLTLSPEEQSRITVRPIDVHPYDPRAYDCYARARHLIHQTTEDSLVQAQRQLEHGTTIVGENAVLLTGMAFVHLYYVDLGIKTDGATLSKARDLTERALALDPNSPLSHHLLGRIERFQGSVTEAIRHFKQALALDPNDPENLMWLGWHYALFAGQPAAAIPLVNRAIEVDPFTPANLLPLMWIRWMEGQLEGAIEIVRKFSTMAPQFRWRYLFHAQLLARNKQVAEALEAIEQAVLENPRDGAATLCSILKYALTGERELALRAIEENKDYLWTDPETPVWTAGWCALLEEKDAALHWLQRAVDRGWINYPLFSEIDPFFEPIRSDDRFRQLMSGLKQKWEAFEP